LSQGGEDIGRMRERSLRMTGDALAHRGPVAAQEDIARPLAEQSERNRGRAADERGLTRGDRGVVRFHDCGKRQIRPRVFVRAEDPGVVGQGGDALQRMEQIARLAFEHAPAACTEQHVADENRTRHGIGQMRARVTGHMPDRDVRKAVDANDVAFADQSGHAGNARVAGAEDRTGVCCRERGDAADMVGMVMRDQDADEGDLKATQGGVDHVGIAGIDRQRAGAGAQQPQVVVGERRQSVDVEAGDRSTCRVWHRTQFFRRLGGLYHNRASAKPSRVMRPSADSSTVAPASWWLRLLAAERRALADAPAPDERELWLSCAVGLPVVEAGVLDLHAAPRRLSGDLVAEPSRWPLRDDSIDRIVLQHAVEVVPDVDALLDEALRVLKPERRILLLTVGALGWTRCRAQFADSGAPALRVHGTRSLLEALAARGCVDLRVSRVDFDGRDAARVMAPARMWSGLCLIEARKRRELPNVRRLRPRLRAAAPASGWIARPTSRSGLAA
jgi:SAM-dependent methyltransferase